MAMVIDKTMRKLECKEMVDWPRLSWVALARKGANTISVFHGGRVEISSTWCAEAVWDGEFSHGDFDRTDLVCGTGIRVREQGVFFVTSGDTLNRLHWYQDDTGTFVSNSLPALLAVADIDLIESYPYADSMASIVEGLQSYRREIPSTEGPIHIVYFNNIKLENDEISEVAKPSSAPDFVDFATYRDYLFGAARRLGDNASAPDRKQKVKPLATMSSGYDSGAAAVVAREAGVREAATISKGRRDASNLFSLDDSGETVAMQLGLNCKGYDRAVEDFPFEDAAWASMGNVGDIHLSLFDYSQPVCLLFTGFMGDVLWGMDTVQPEPLHRKDTSGARFNEMRLELGVIICSPVFWGCQKESQILDLSNLPEMQPWVLGNDYDRPIPRRLLEEAGVRRGTFAHKKRVASFNRRYGQPLSHNLRKDFSLFLEERGLRPGSWLSEKASLALSGIDWWILRKLPPFIRFSCKDWVTLPTPSMFFLWANRRRRQRYLRGLEMARTDASISVTAG